MDAQRRHPAYGRVAGSVLAAVATLTAMGSTPAGPSGAPLSARISTVADAVPAEPPTVGRRTIAEAAPAPTGRTIKVAKDGSGDHTSIQEAAEQAGPGDTVLISDGTYDEPFTVPRDGTQGAYITYRAAPGADVVIDGGGDRSAGQGMVEMTGRSFIRWIGISVRGSSSHGVYAENAADIVLEDCEVAGSSNGGAVFLSSKNISVEHCEVHGNNARGTSASHEAISFDGVDGFEVSFTVVRDNGEEGIDAKYESRNGKIHDNTVSGNRGPNIYVDSANNVDVYNNFVTGTTEGSKAGISIAIEDLSDTRRTYAVKVYNNIVTRNAGGGIGFWTESSGSFEDIEIVNNTIVDNSNGGLNIVSGDFGGTNLLRNNIFSGNDDDIAGDAGSFTADHNLFSAGGIGSNLIKGAASFVDAAAHDLRLKPNSAGIKAGSPTGAPAFDITGAERPTGAVDIGAFDSGAKRALKIANLTSGTLIGTYATSVPLVSR